MPSSIGLFSRRKNSDDKALRAALAPQVDPYIYSTLQQPAPPHSAPLMKKSLPKPQPIVSGFAAENAGLVFAPHLTRARTTTFDEPPESVQVRSRKPLIRSSSQGFGRRTKSFDQRPPVEGYMEVPPFDQRRCQSSSPALQQESGHLSALGPVNYSRAGTPRNRVPLAAAGTNQSNAGYYSPASGYPASPPLSPESSLAVGYGMGDGLGLGVEYDPEVCFDIHHLCWLLLANNVFQQGQRRKYTSARSIHELGVPNRENGPSNLGNSYVVEAESAQEANSRELAALRFGTENWQIEHDPSLEDLEDTQQRRQREFELVDAVKGKERELEFLRSNSHGYREQIAVMEQVLAQKDEELENARARIYELSQNQARNRNTPMVLEGISEMGLADMGRKLMEEIRRRERAEKQLVETAAKAKSDLDKAMAEEEKKRGEIRAAVRREFEHTLHHEERLRDEAQRKSRENLQNALGEEEKRRAELNWLFGERVEKVERLRRNDLEEFQKNMAGLKEEKERLEKQLRENAQEIERNRQSVHTQRDANEELLDMTKKINTRLGEEKRRNRHLEEKINQITEDALNNVSGANREVFMLRNEIEDKDTKIKFFETELAAVKKDKKAMEEAWADMETELEEARQTLLNRDERVKGLEEENMKVVDRLEVYRKESDEFRQKSSDGEQRVATPETEDMAKTMELLKEDIELYKKDVKVYKKDVKKRDNQIRDLKRGVAELESLLESKTLETKVLQDAVDNLASYRESSPSSNDSSGSESASPLRDEIKILKQKIQMYEKEYRAMYEDYEALKKKHDLFVSQQAMIITEIDKQLTRARKEKDAVEAAATRQFKKMQHGFLQLSQNAVAGQLAGVGGGAVKRYQEVALPPLPAGLEDSPRSPKRSNSAMKRTGSKAKSGKRSASLFSEKVGVGLSPVTEPVVKMEAVVKVVGEEENFRERAKLERTMSVLYEPDGALGEEEVIEW